jgi:hypothetical protein
VCNTDTDPTATMSEEEEIHIEKLEDGEISEIILVCTEDRYEECEADTNIDQFTDDPQSEEHEFDVKEGLDDNGDELEDDNDDGLVDKENVYESGVQYCSNEDLNFGEVTSFSTPAVTKDAAIVSHSDADIVPFKEIESLTIKSSIGVDAEGNNDNLSEASCGCCYDDDRECNHVTFAKAQTRESLMIPGLIRVPIVGHETMEARSKFTVFKIHVMVEDDDVGWFIFRRYSDFVNLNDQLKLMFPSFRFILPPKRWFKSNFDSDFLEERQQGLQSFIDNITGHRDICKCKPVRDFFCFDDPPGPHDSLEESRAQCECLEEQVYVLRKELLEKDTEIELLKEEMDLYKNQVQLLSNRLNQLNKMGTLDRSASERHHSKSDDKQLDAETVSLPGDIVLTNNLDSVSEFQ